MYYVSVFCQQALWLRDGRAEAYGPHRTRWCASTRPSWRQEASGRRRGGRDRAGAGAARAAVRRRLRAVRLAAAAARPYTAWRAADLEIDVRRPIRRRSTSTSASASTARTARRSPPSRPTSTAARRSRGDTRYRLRLSIPRLPLVKGEFTLYVFLLDESALHVYDERIVPAAFRVDSSAYRFGLVDVDHAWELETAPSPRPSEPICKRRFSDDHRRPASPGEAAGAGGRARGRARPAAACCTSTRTASTTRSTDRCQRARRPRLRAAVAPRGGRAGGRRSGREQVASASRADGWLLAAERSTPSRQYLLKYVSLEAHTVCNQACYFCPVSVDPREDYFMPTEQLRAHRRRARRLARHDRGGVHDQLQRADARQALRRPGAHHQAGGPAAGGADQRLGPDAGARRRLVEMGGLRFLSINLSTPDRERYRATAAATT